ncbi:MAG: AAA family ATPase [Myxococcaceae bacterium]
MRQAWGNAVTMAISQWPDYTAQEVLREDERVTLYRGFRNTDRHPVLIEALGSAPRRPGDLRRLGHAYEIGSRLDIPAVVHSLDLEDGAAGPALILDDDGSEPLLRHVTTPMGLKSFLKLSIRIAQTLAEAHAHGLVHKDLRPENILVHPRTGEVKLTNLALASLFQQAQQSAPRLVEGSLPYMSPEQTGRMNHGVDHRTDLYSLGIALYELLTGRPPFQAGDPLSWIHHHLAHEPPPLPEEIPEVVCSIVFKLLKKVPEDRYQSALGLKLDLERCLDSLTSAGRIEPFELAMRDVSDRFHVPQRLYGREREVEKLVAAFDRVVETGSPVRMFISGYSGVGKSTLIRELYKPLVRERGLLLEGKFDQLRQGIPYSTLSLVFGSLLGELLDHGEEQLAQWRRRLRAALGVNGKLMTDLIPALQTLLGAQPPVPPLPLDEDERRFRRVFRRFLGVFTRREHVLALLLDDLQWVDSATLSLLQDVLTHPDTRYLLFIGVFRDNEVGPSHPLSIMLKEIRSAGATVNQLGLEPLPLQHVVQLVADAVRRPRQDVQPLAELVYERTAGNPFFAVQLLTSLHQEGLIRFDPRSASWRWSLGAIRARGFTHEVVDLMLERLRALPEATKDGLKLAACLGSRVEVATLAMVRAQSVEELHRDLWEAIRAGVLSRSEEEYRFVHDRLRQAALALIPDAERDGVRLRLGQLLLSNIPKARLSERIFEVVNQLNAGAAGMRAPEERQQLAELNLLAARKALAGVAFGPAAQYLAKGIALLPADAWERLHALTLALHLERAQAEFLSNRFEEAERSLAVVLSHCRTVVARATAYALGVQLDTKRAQLGKAVARAVEYFGLCGIEIPLHPSRDQVKEQYVQVLAAVGARPIESLVDLPAATDTETEALLSVLMVALPAAIFFDVNTWSVLTCLSARLSIERGRNDSSALAFSTFALLSGAIVGDYRQGQRFGDLSLVLVEERGLAAFRARVHLQSGCMVTYWVKPLATVLLRFEQAFRVCVESGDLAYACYCCMILISVMISRGVALPEIQREAATRLSFVQSERFELVASTLLSAQLLVQCLRGHGDVDEAELERRVQGLGSMAIFMFYTRRLQARFLLGEYPAALAAAEEARPHAPASRVLPEAVDYVFFHALTLARTGSHQGLEEHERQLWAWADTSPENFVDRAALVSAEIARLDGGDLRAMHLYEQAIAAARDNGFLHGEALAYELAARFYEERGFDAFARMCFANARALYARWGAEVKVKALEDHHPELAPQGLPPTATFTARRSDLDLLSVVKASQRISSELVLDDLSRTLVRVVMEQGAAQSGYLILSREGQLTLEAAATFGEKGLRVELLPSVPVAGSGRVPEGIVEHAARTREAIILDGAAPLASALRDDGLEERKPRSVLCMPLKRRTEAVGFLYLENALVPGAFTHARLMVLELLASQAAISVENARLLARERVARTAAAQAQWRSGFLAESGARLAESLAYDEVLHVLSQQSVPLLADWCEFDMVEDGRLQRRAGRHVDPAKRALLEELAERYPPQWDSPHPAARVLRSGQTLLLPERTGRQNLDETLREHSVDSAHAELIRRLGTKAMLVVPLRTRARFLGVFTLASATADRYGPPEVELVEELGRRAAMALENALLYRQAREAIRVRDDFLSIASHELRTPLTPLQLQIQALQRQVRARGGELGTEERTEKRLDVILRQTKRLARLVDELLNISRIVGGRMRLELEPVDLSAVVRDVVDTLREQEEIARSASEVRVSAAPGVVGRWDRLRVEQVVTNLVSNALKFGAGKPVDIHVQSSATTATLTVVDRGIGIRPETVGRIFGRFERAVSEKHYGGLGLGLFIVKQIVDALGGAIQVQSRPDAGATFTVTLPLSGPQEVALPQPAVSP